MKSKGKKNIKGGFVELPQYSGMMDSLRKGGQGSDEANNKSVDSLHYVVKSTLTKINSFVSQ